MLEFLVQGVLKFTSAIKCSMKLETKDSTIYFQLFAITNTLSHKWQRKYKESGVNEKKI